MHFWMQVRCGGTGGGAIFLAPAFLTDFLADPLEDFLDELFFVAIIEAPLWVETLS
jgi:hypothetical protein